MIVQIGKTAGAGGLKLLSMVDEHSREALPVRTDPTTPTASAPH